MKLEPDSKFLSSPQNFFSLFKEFSEIKDQSKRGPLYLTLLEKFEFPAEKDFTDIARWVKSIEAGLAQKDSTIRVLHRLVLAMAYQYGVGVSQNRVHAYAIYQKLHQEEPDNSLVLNNLAYCCQYGYGVERDEKQAFLLLKRAAAQGDPVPLNNLGICFRDGIGTAPNPDKAALLFENAAKFNHKALYNQGSLNDKDHIIKMLHLGSVPALNQTRELYGREEALKYLEIAAARRNLQAWYILGSFYRWGSLLTQADTALRAPADLNKALEYYQKVADAVDIEDSCPPDYGHWPDCWPDIAIAANYVANIYKELIYADAKNVEKACAYFQKLIRIHESRREFVPNLKEMDLDFCRAYLFMARCFRDGLGVESNLAKSNEYFQIVLDYEKQNISIENHEAKSFYDYPFELDTKINPEAKIFYDKLWHIPQRQPLNDLLQDFKKEKKEGRCKLYVTLQDRFKYPSPKDDAEAKIIISSLESKGDNDLIVGFAYNVGLGVVQNPRKAFNHFEGSKKLSAGHPDRDLLAFQLISCYELGFSVAKDPKRAETLLEVEAKNGNPILKISDKISHLIHGNFIAVEFAVNLGSTKALGVAADFLDNYKSFKLIEIAAERNELQALYFYFKNYHRFYDKEQYIPMLISYQKKILSLIDYFEIGFKENAEDLPSYKETIVLYFKITERIADVLHSEQDYKNSFSYYNQILKDCNTQRGNILQNKYFFWKIYYLLALYHRDGLGTAIDLKKYFEYLEIVAENGNASSTNNLYEKVQYLLALSYWQGIGTSENVTKSLAICETVYTLDMTLHFLERPRQIDFSLLVGKIAVKDFKEPHSGLALLRFFYAAIRGSREGLYLLIKHFNFQNWRYCLDPSSHDSNNFNFRNTYLLRECMPYKYTNSYGSLDSLPILFFYGSARYADIGFSEQPYDEKISGEDPAGRIMLACFYQNGIAGMEKNPAKARQLLQEQAEAGDGLAHFLQGYALANGIECKKDLTVAAFLYRKAIFLGCDASDFLAGLIRENPRNLKVMYHYCMSDVEKLVEQLDRNSKIILQLWQKEYHSLPDSEFKDFSLSRMREADARKSRSLTQFFSKPGQYPWRDQVFYQLGMDEIEKGISKQQNKENKEDKSVAKHIKTGIEFFSSLSPENLSPSENFDVGFFLFNLRMEIEYLKSSEISEKIYAHWRRAAMDGNVDARRYLLTIAASRFDPCEFSDVYPHHVHEDKLFSANNFKELQDGFYRRLTSPGKNDDDQKSSAPSVELKAEIKGGFDMRLLMSTSKTPGQRLSGLFPDFFVQNSQKNDEFYLCSPQPLNTQEAGSLVEKLETILRDAGSSITVQIDKIDPSFDECTIKLSNVTKAALNGLSQFHRRIQDLTAALPGSFEFSGS